MVDLVSLLAGAAVGSLTTLWWEGFLKPRIVGRSLAELLAADLSLQLQRLAAERSQLEQAAKHVPSPLPFPTVVYAAVISRVGELPPPIVAETIVMYGILDRLNQAAARAGGFLEQLEQAEEPSDAAVVAEHRLKRELAQWPLLLDNALQRAKALQPKMIATARPWWSLRHRSAPPVKELDHGSVSARVAELRDAVDRRHQTLNENGGQ